MNAVVAAGSAVAVVALTGGLIVARRSRALRRRRRFVLAPAAAPARWSVVRAWRMPSLAVAPGPPWRAVSLAVAVGASAGFLLGGVVAAVALGAYGAVGIVLLRRRRVAAARRAARSALLDWLTGLAADLRAGVPVQAATAAAGAAGGRLGAGSHGGSPESGPGASRLVANAAVPTVVGSADPIAAAVADDPSAGDGPGLLGLARAAAMLAERTGAPLADLIDRIEADARAGDRARAAALAQAAGAQATALLLAALPVGGLALGYAIGADPLTVLLRTPLGAVCALCAVALQILGLLWSQRLQPRLP